MNATEKDATIRSYFRAALQTALDVIGDYSTYYDFGVGELSKKKGDLERDLDILRNRKLELEKCPDWKNRCEVMFDQYIDTLKSTIKTDKAELQLLKQARKRISPADDICKAVIARIDADIKRTQQCIARNQKDLKAVQADHKKDTEKFAAKTHRKTLKQFDNHIADAKAQLADVEEKLRQAQLAVAFRAKYATKKGAQNGTD